jgi:DNA-binding phage protein
MNDEEVKAYQATQLAALRQELADATAPDPLAGPKRDFLLALIDTRLKKRLTQTDIAQRTGLKRSAITRLESGRGNPGLNTLLKISQALDIKFVPQSVKIETNKQGKIWNEP